MELIYVVTKFNILAGRYGSADVRLSLRARPSRLSYFPGFYILTAFSFAALFYRGLDLIQLGS